MPGAFDWLFTDPSDPTGGYLARVLGISEPPSSPIIPGMIPNRSTAGMGGPLGLGQASPFVSGLGGAVGGAARGYATGGGPLGALGGAIGGGAKAALTPELLQALGAGGSAAGTAVAGGSGWLANLLPFLFA